jgi:rsbT antagonist protein RsbS
MEINSAGALMTLRGTLLVKLAPSPTDHAVRLLREHVGRTLEAESLRGLVVHPRAIDAMDSYIRDLAIGARPMGVPTVVCGVQPNVADTLVEMGLDLGDVRTAVGRTRRV